MPYTAKLLVVGPPDGPQGQVVASISEVKVRSSARTASGEGTVPMDFGRVRISADLDLQLFGFERDRIGAVAEAVAPGVVGAILIAEDNDRHDPHYASAALDELATRGIPTVIALDGRSSDPGPVQAVLGAGDIPVIPYFTLDRATVKSMVVSALEAAVAAAEGSAA